MARGSDCHSTRSPDKDEGTVIGVEVAVDWTSTLGFNRR